MQLFKDVFKKRYFGYFILTFIFWYVLSFFLSGFMAVLQTPLMFIIGQVFSPLLLLLMSWLYFRKAHRNDWPSRFTVAISWIVLSLIASALLVPYAYGYDWTSILNTRVLDAQWINIAAILVGGFLGAKEKPNPELEKLIENIKAGK